MAAIYITEANNTQHSFRLPAEEGSALTIGRNDDCGVSLPLVEGLSGLHCSITRSGDQYIIKDEGSSNGTYVDGRAISSEALRAGAVYVIGNAAMAFDPETAAVPAAKPRPKKTLGTSSSALAEAAASIGVGKRRKVASSALAEAAASIGVKGVGNEPAPVAPPAVEPSPVAEPVPAAEPTAAEVAYAAPEDAAPAEPQVVEEQPAPADVAAPAPKKKKHARKLPAGVPSLKKKSQAVAAGNMFYVIIVLALAFYAGMTLRHWMETGTYLPTFEPAKAAKK